MAFAPVSQSPNQVDMVLGAVTTLENGPDSPAYLSMQLQLLMSYKRR